MIGMPRMRLTRTIAVAASARMPDTRISAHTMPSTVESTSEPSVTRMVLRTPNSRMGMNSIESARKRFMQRPPPVRALRARPPSPCGGGTRKLLQPPLREYLFERAVGLELGERGVDAFEQVAVVLAHADADRAE